jgi:hypothetical protein
MRTLSAQSSSATIATSSNPSSSPTITANPESTQSDANDALTDPANASEEEDLPTDPEKELGTCTVLTFILSCQPTLMILIRTFEENLALPDLRLLQA